MKTISFRDRTALITGGSSGIGFETARVLAGEGARLILTASSRERLEKSAAELHREYGRRPETIIADLTEPDSPRKLFETLNEKKTAVDILVNNAGFGTLGAYADSGLDRSLEMIEVNVKALCALTHYFAAPMQARGQGWILNVASTAAFQSIPLEAVYGATKAFVLSFSVALHEELAPRGVAVTCLCPGPTETAFFSQGGFRKTSKMFRSRVPAAPVARAGVDALKKNKAIVIAGTQNAIGAFGTRLVGRTLAAKIAKKVVE